MSNANGYVKLSAEESDGYYINGAGKIRSLSNAAKGMHFEIDKSDEIWMVRLVDTSSGDEWESATYYPLKSLAMEALALSRSDALKPECKAEGPSIATSNLTPTLLTKEQQLALSNLKSAIANASQCELFDFLAASIHPDIINDFCDAVEEFAIDNASPLSDSEDGCLLETPCN